MSCSFHPQWVHSAADCPFCEHVPKGTRVLARAYFQVYLQAIQQRCEKATPGPWRSMSAGNCQMEDGLLAPIAEVEGLPRPWSPVWVGWQVAKNYFKTFLRQEDADFVAHARDDIPWLMAQLHAIQIATQELQQALETFDNNVTDAEHDPTLEMAVFRAAREVVRKTSLLPK